MLIIRVGILVILLGIAIYKTIVASDQYPSMFIGMFCASSLMSLLFLQLQSDRSTALKWSELYPELGIGLVTGTCFYLLSTVYMTSPLWLLIVPGVGVIILFSRVNDKAQLAWQLGAMIVLVMSP